MKTYDQLTTEQQKRAVAKCLENLVEDIALGFVRFDDELNGDNLQKRIDAAWQKANKMQTPWFFGEYLLDTCRADLESMAQVDAEGMLYAENNEKVMYDIATVLKRELAQ